MTHGLEGRCSIQLSYGRKAPGARLNGCAAVGALGFEPRTSCSQSRRANRAALRPADISSGAKKVSRENSGGQRRVLREIGDATAVPNACGRCHQFCSIGVNSCCGCRREFLRGARELAARMTSITPITAVAAPFKVARCRGAPHPHSSGLLLFRPWDEKYWR